MKFDRRSFLGLGAGLGLAGTVVVANRALAFGFSDITSKVGLGGDSGTSAVDPVQFMKYLNHGTRSLAYSVAEMNEALELNDNANAIRTFLRDESKKENWKTAVEVADEFKIPPGAELKSTTDNARKCVLKAWVFGTYGGFMDKKASDSAQALASSASVDAKTMEAARAAGDAIQLLPPQVEQAGLIVSNTVEYMSNNGIATPSQQEIMSTVSEGLGEPADDSFTT
jgi:hypothetical protein